MSYEDKELSLEEEEQHIKRGAWLALPLLPFLMLCICGVFAITPGGRAALADFIVQYAYDGVPLPENVQIMYTRGFPGAARASCVLERKNPRPGNYKQAQERLAAEYESLAKLYKDNWKILKNSGQDMSEYKPIPADVPSDLVGGTRTYCR